jgi:PBP1b-binding outer membrane lipoprotein LpoB
MKKLMILFCAALLISCSTSQNLPFAPREKAGKHKTEKQKPVKKTQLKNCLKF